MDKTNCDQLTQLFNLNIIEKRNIGIINKFGYSLYNLV
jgi:hypothetical protein